MQPTSKCRVRRRRRHRAWWHSRSRSDRRGKVLFIDARKLGTTIDRVHRELTDEDIREIADTYHARSGDKDCDKEYADVPGICKSATPEEIRAHGSARVAWKPTLTGKNGAWIGTDKASPV